MTAAAGFGALAALLLVATPVRAEEPAATRLVRETTEQLQALIHEHRDEYVKNRAKFNAVMDERLTPVFDIPALSHRALGVNWRKATPAQQERFQAAFKATLIRAYSTVLLVFSESVRLQWAPQTGNDEATRVHANVIRPQGPPLDLGFDLHKAGGAWKVYDIKVGAVSLIEGYKSQFTSEVKRNGLEALIRRLEGAVRN